ncbi:type III secretion system needle length determinant [Pseudomonas mosselii]|uniref:type III secretion system needle length determinant n=1 Tax=Pseudomonas mosselii TaxID=78327 RepID=UPI0015E8B358|nr:type III secretion system needle length determinant [Pseudomonas mosselii]
MFEQLLENPQLERGAPQNAGHRPVQDAANPGRPVAQAVLNMAAPTCQFPAACAPQLPARIENAIERPLPASVSPLPDEAEPTPSAGASRTEASPQTAHDSTGNELSRLIPSDTDPIPAPSPTSGERPLIDRILPSTVVGPTQDLQTLVERLQLQLYGSRTGTREQTLLQMQLPQLGHVEVRMNHVSAGLQVEIQAAPTSLRQLQMASMDLLDRLQRLDPAQPVGLGFGANGDNQQGSRNRRHVEDEGWPEP